MKGDERSVLGIEEIFAFQLAVLHAAPGIHRVSLNLDIQNASRRLRRTKGQSRVPLVELAVDSHRLLDGEVHRTFLLRDRKDWNTKIEHWENGVLGIGFQCFNFFNHANFGLPDNWSSDGAFGQIFYQEQSPTSVLGSGLNANVSARMIQVSAQLQF